MRIGRKTFITYVCSLGLILFSQIATAGQAYIGPVSILQLNVVGVSFLTATSGNVEVKLPTGFLPAGLSCTDTQYLTSKAADVNSNEFALLALARQTNAKIYIWISDDPAHTAVSGRCSFYTVNF